MQRYGLYVYKIRLDMHGTARWQRRNVLIHVCIVFNMSVRLMFLMTVTQIMCNPADDPFDSHSIWEIPHACDDFSSDFPFKVTHLYSLLKHENEGENCESGKGAGESYMRKILKFNDFKAIIKVRLILGGGQYATNTIGILYLLMLTC